MALFRFGEFEADESTFELRRGGKTVPVQRIVLETIFFLIRSQGRAVSKSDLLRGPWRGHKVSDAAVSRAVMLARRALDDSSSRLIGTVHGVGYRFLAPVAQSSSELVQADHGVAHAFANRLFVAERDDLPSSTGSTTRLAELAALRRALEKSRQGRGRLVLVKGQPGVGKTALVEHFARRCSAQGTLVAWGRAWDSRSVPPLWHWLEVARSCCGFLERTAVVSSGAALRSTFALLVGELEQFSKKSSESEELLRVFDAVTRCLDQLSRAQPLVVTLEGLQDADQGSLRLLDFLRQRLGQMPLLVIATARPPRCTEPDAAALDEAAPHVHVLELPPR